jgi:hypothetical protein
MNTGARVPVCEAHLVLQDSLLCRTLAPETLHSNGRNIPGQNASSSCLCRDWGSEPPKQLAATRALRWLAVVDI